ncbi:MAG: replicative DNA helicase [Candidatus Parcubacteria bacterium]|nr:MAG: replicative DNA helicase [Candidatus Parcubacteria bacterium]
MAEEIFKSLPNNQEAEIALLGAILIDPEAIYKVVDILKPDDFYKPAHQIIYSSILYLFEKRESIDVITVTNRLREIGELENIGGAGYVFELISKTPTVSNVIYYAKIIRDKKARRDLIQTAYEIQSIAYEEEKSSEELIDEIGVKIFKVAERVYPKEFFHISQFLESAYQRIEELHTQEKKLRGVSTGFPLLDEYLGGLQKSDLIILASRPSLGKTSLALTFARHIALNENKPVAIFSLEMSKDQVIDRLLASEAGVSLWRLRTGKLFYEGEINELALISEALDRLNQSPIYIDDTPNLNTLQIRTMSRKLKHQIGEIGLIIIDYLQLLKSNRYFESRVQEITEISRSLKELARELNVPILALSQLSRAPEQRISQVPKLSDLRDSGSIEQDADVVLFIHRPKEIGQVVPSNQSDIIIAKQRNGPLGVVTLYFDPETTSFYSTEQAIEEIELH